MVNNKDKLLNIAFLNNLHEEYLKKINFLHIPVTELTRFSWSENKKITLYVIKVFSDYPGYNHSTMYFATKSNAEKDKVKFLDFTKETAVPEFSRINDSEVLSRTAWLVSQKLMNKEISQIIILSSAIFNFEDFKGSLDDKNFFERWAKEWVDKEYDKTQDAEKSSTPVQAFPDFPSIKQRFFIDRYHFKDMLSTINNDQFTDEFDQCLFAYEHEKWFLCATGLGSCLEHLMLIILSNYDKNGFRDENGGKIFKNFPKNPTAQDYVRLFRKDPINISSRQATFINLLYMARNSVDHHNTGKTQKNLCDLLLDGISDMYNDYYPSSVLFKSNKRIN